MPAPRVSTSAIGAHIIALAARQRGEIAAFFFLFFALQIETAELPQVALPALGLAVVTVATKAITGWRAAALAGVGERGRARAAAALIAHGELSIVVAGIAAGLEPRLGPLATGYVLILAISGPVLMRFAEDLVPSRALPARVSVVR